MARLIKQPVGEQLHIPSINAARLSIQIQASHIAGIVQDLTVVPSPTERAQSRNGVRNPGSQPYRRTLRGTTPQTMRYCLDLRLCTRRVSCPLRETSNRSASLFEHRLSPKFGRQHRHSNSEWVPLGAPDCSYGRALSQEAGRRTTEACPQSFHMRSRSPTNRKAETPKSCPSKRQTRY